MFVESRNKAICDVPDIGIGNKPIDGGFYLFDEEEMKEFVCKEPRSEKYFRRYYGAQEFLQNKARYCLWLGNASPSELNSMPECKKRVAAVREFRLNSSSAGTRKLADKPTRFHVENMPDYEFIIVPCHSSENRRYIPFGFVTPDAIASNAVLIIPNASLFHFGVIESCVHMSWMRAVCGRLEMRYRYSKDIVYNNFPWPTPTDAQKAKIEKTAQAILDARNIYPDCSLADLYDEVTMPPELRKAHKENDKAVMEAYGFDPRMSEAEIVAELFKLYQEITQSR